MTVSEERIKDLMYGRLERLPSYLSATDRVDLQSICTELLAARREWQPIETAPKDGRIIIGWSAGWESATAIQWVPSISYEYETGLVHEEGGWDWNGTIQCPPSHDPTHWMPLPPPPETAV